MSFRYKEVIRPSADSLIIVMEYADDGDLQAKVNLASTTHRPIPEDTARLW